MPKIKKKDIDDLQCPAGKNLEYVWDSSLPGFGVRCTEKGVKSYVVRYRINSVQRIKTLARTSVIDLSEARSKAREKLGEAHGGADPFIASTKDIQTVNDLCREFQTGRKNELKPKTHKAYESLWKHITAALGPRAIIALDEQAVKILKNHLSGKETTFNRCVSLIRAALMWQGALPDNHPFKRAKLYKEKPAQRILSKNESGNFYRALGEFKRRRETGWRYADLFILLLLTGLRRDEWRKGRWEWLDLERGLYTLPDNKTGGRVVHLSSLAVEVLTDMNVAQRKRKTGYIFPAAKTRRKPMSWTWRQWDDMRRKVGLNDFRIHDMRHTAGSFAHASGGLSQRQVADFLGHTRIETANRYIHDNEKKQSAEAASAAIAESWDK